LLLKLYKRLYFRALTKQPCPDFLHSGVICFRLLRTGVRIPGQVRDISSRFFSLPVPPLVPSICSCPGVLFTVLAFFYILFPIGVVAQSFALASRLEDHLLLFDFSCSFPPLFSRCSRFLAHPSSFFSLPLSSFSEGGHRFAAKYVDAFSIMRPVRS